MNDSNAVFCVTAIEKRDSLTPPVFDPVASFCRAGISPRPCRPNKLASTGKPHVILIHTHTHTIELDG